MMDTSFLAGEKLAVCPTTDPLHSHCTATELRWDGVALLATRGITWIRCAIADRASTQDKHAPEYAVKNPSMRDITFVKLLRFARSNQASSASFQFSF